MPDTPQPPWWRSTAALVVLSFLLVGGFLLLTEHRSHVLGIFPYLLLLACPLLHLFHGHDGHRRHARSGEAQHSPAEHDRAAP